ncbi:MAG TPA: hypothetical protein VLZ53_00570 [Devosia sp.]|jgi:hypothetical protein|nr:hypothetical protein [Devosia sp.]
MTTGRYVTDLDLGDVLGPCEYTLSSFVIREYAHIVEMHHECFQGADDLIMPPTLIHLDKLRLYNAACPAGTGPTARIHYEYDAEVFAPARVGDKLSVIGRIKDRYLKKGREYVLLEMELSNAETGELLVRYRDQVILAFAQKSEASA